MQITPHMQFWDISTDQDPEGMLTQTSFDSPEFDLDLNFEDDMDGDQALPEATIKQESSLTVIESSLIPIAISPKSEALPIIMSDAIARPVASTKTEISVAAPSDIHLPPSVEISPVFELVSTNVSANILDQELEVSISMSTPSDQTVRPIIKPQFPILTNSHPALQIVAQNLLIARETQKGIIVRLDPPEMGRVYIDFQFDSDRTVTAIIKSEFAETNHQLRNRSDYFRLMLEDSGFESVILSFEHDENDQNSMFNQAGDSNLTELLSETSPRTSIFTAPIRPNTPVQFTSDTLLDIRI